MGGQIALTPCLQPQLMRSSQLPSRPDFNIYDAPKAEVHIAGDLATMAKGWSTEEWAAKRRLVKVWRRQDGHNIFLAFAPMPQVEWHAEKDCVVISCMFREERNSCWVTSVDMLYLLEAVIGNRFSVEEKNRIRRNLEGFRPQTISKNKTTSDTFFRTIMSYPPPRPRNIEKDVKVFPFEVVASAVKKIVSKYVSPLIIPSSVNANDRLLLLVMMVKPCCTILHPVRLVLPSLFPMNERITPNHLFPLISLRSLRPRTTRKLNPRSNSPKARSRARVRRRSPSTLLCSICPLTPWLNNIST